MSKHEQNGYASFADLGEVLTAIEITAPDGRPLRLRLRTLGGNEILQVRRSMTWPTEPWDLGRDPVDGKVKRLPIMDGPKRQEYEDALSDTTSEQMHRLLVRSLVGLDIPGETEGEQATALRDKLGFWAMKQLTSHLMRLNRIGDEEVEQAAANLPLGI